jgi:putative oxidoreductase
VSLLRRVSHPLLASIFVTTGVETLLDPGPYVQRAREAGLDSTPVGDAATLTRGAAAIQVGAGVMLATNRMPRLSALALAASLVPTTYSRHRFWTETDKQVRRQERSQLLKDVGLLGGLLITVADTGGRESIPHRMGRGARKTRRKAKRAIPAAVPV